jgi:hypothetical protein
MLIEIYRNEVKEAYEQLLTVTNPPERSEMDKCVRGDLDDFYLFYCRGADDWETYDHWYFYHACEVLKDKEAEEYKHAMQWVPS